MEEEKVRESGLTLTDIWLIIKRHLLAIIIIVVAFSAVGMVYSKFEKPMYKSTASVLVSYKDESDETPATTELSVSRFLADEYVDMLKDDKIMLTAKKKLSPMGIAVSASSIRGNLRLNHNDNGVYIKMEYTCGDPFTAQSILQCIIDSSIEVLNETKKDAEGNEITDNKGNPVYIHEKLHGSLAIFGDPTVGSLVSNTATHTLVFMALGIVFACVYVFVREIANKRYRNFREIERDLGVSVYAVVPYVFVEKNENSAKKAKNGKEGK